MIERDLWQLDSRDFVVAEQRWWVFDGDCWTMTRRGQAVQQHSRSDDQTCNVIKRTSSSDRLTKGTGSER